MICLVQGPKTVVIRLPIGEVMLLAHDSKKLENAKAEIELNGPVQSVSIDLYEFNYLWIWIANLNTKYL